MPEHACVLDIGCGAGSLMLRAAAEGRVAEGLGVDVSEAALEAARTAWQALSSRLPATRLGFARDDASCMTGRTWEVVTMIDVVHHVPPAEQEAFMRRAFRCVAPGGRMIYKDVCLRPLWKRAMNRLHDLVMARQWICEVPLEKVRDWAVQEGLQVLVEQHYGRLWYGHELLVLRRPEAGQNP